MKHTSFCGPLKRECRHFAVVSLNLARDGGKNAVRFSRSGAGVRGESSTWDTTLFHDALLGFSRNPPASTGRFGRANWPVR